MSCSRTQHSDAGDASIIVFANLCCVCGDDNGGGSHPTFLPISHMVSYLIAFIQNKNSSVFCLIHKSTFFTNKLIFIALPSIQVRYW